MPPNLRLITPQLSLPSGIKHGTVIAVPGTVISSLTSALASAYQLSDDVPDHLWIVDALLQRDSGRAVRAIDRHIQSITRVLVEIVFADD